MRDLRNGVKLKKVQERQYNPLPIEYQLTPYEMLMDDIRSKRYTLRKVMVSQENHCRFSNPKCYFPFFYFLFVFLFLLRILKLLFLIDTNIHLFMGLYGITNLCSALRREHETNTCSVLCFPCGRHFKFWKTCLPIISLFVIIITNYLCCACDHFKSHLRNPVMLSNERLF